jgi:hypothetical protein
MTFWEIHLVILAYLGLLLIPTLITFLIFKNTEGTGIRYFKMLFLPVMEALAVAVCVLTLFPVVLGLGEDVLWGFPIKVMTLSPGGGLGLIGVLIFLALVLAAIPRLRRLHSFKTLVLGGVSLIFVQFFLSVMNPVIEVELMDLVPGFWFICGVVITAGVLSKLGHVAASAFTTVLGNRFDLRRDVAELLILPVLAASGFFPVFMYGAWLA